MGQDAREAAAFIRPMLEMDPDKRASAQQMLDHPWLQGLGTPAEEVRFGGRTKASKAPINSVKNLTTTDHNSACLKLEELALDRTAIFPG